MSQINDLKRTALADAVGKQGNINDLELEWLKTQGVLAGAINAGWYEYLGGLGFTGSLPDRIFNWLGSKGFSGSIQERWYQLWLSGDIGGGGPPPVGGKIFSTDLYTSTGSVVNGIDCVNNDAMLWIKSRTTASDHYLINTLSPTKQLRSNDTGPEGNAFTFLDSFNVDGYSHSGSPTGDKVGWLFRKASKFFDPKFHTVPAGNMVVNHDLGVAPGLVIAKQYTGGGGFWAVFHKDLASNEYLQLNSTQLKLSWGGNVAFDENTLDFGAFWNVAAGQGLVVYAFAHDPTGVIQCGGYAGNGTSSNIISLGWEPEYILIKRVSGGTENWLVIDDKRSNVVGSMQGELVPNSTIAEAQLQRGVFNSDGFELTSAGGAVNASGSDYIYMAIKKSNATAQAIPSSGLEGFENFEGWG